MAGRAVYSKFANKYGAGLARAYLYGDGARKMLNGKITDSPDPSLGAGSRQATILREMEAENKIFYQDDFWVRNDNGFVRESRKAKSLVLKDDSTLSEKIRKAQKDLQPIRNVISLSKGKNGMSLLEKQNKIIDDLQKKHISFYGKPLSI